MEQSTDNPKFREREDMVAKYIIGFRNPQGLTISPHDNDIYFSQHGQEVVTILERLFMGEI